MQKKYLIIILVVAVAAIAAGLMYAYQKDSSVSEGNSNTPPVVGEVKKGLGVYNLQENDTISSPFKVAGYVNGDGWGGFEGQVGNVSLYDNNNNLLVTKPMVATSEWMATLVNFSADLEFNTTATSGKIVFRNENPSGEPSRDKEVSWNIQFIPMAAAETMSVQAYFSNSKLDPEITCEKVFPVKRVVAKTAAVARAALEELLKGPNAGEQALGYVTNINEGVQIKSLTIENGVAKVDFSEEIQREVGGACRVTAIRAQIVETLNQFATVKSVVISVNGNTEDILQP